MITPAMSSNVEAWNRVVKDMWKHWEEGRLLPAETYVRQCPDRADEIRAEFAAIRNGVTTPDDTVILASPGGSDDRPGRVGPYSILSEMEGGGMGRVFVATRDRLESRVILKTLSWRYARSGEARQRLEREARIGARLDHPGICSVIDIQEDQDHLYIVMPLIPGETLRQKLRLAFEHTEDEAAPTVDHFWLAFDSTLQPKDGPAPEDARPETSTKGTWSRPGLAGSIRLLRKVTLAVHAAHEAGVVHRDLKPANIMVRPDGEPVVLDFGLARETDSDTDLTEPHTAIGTVVHMAPEQARGEPGLDDPRIDVYALGTILYEMLTGQAAFRGTTGVVLEAIKKGDFRRPRLVSPKAPRDLEAVCLKAMERAAENRYASAEDLAADLGRFLDHLPTLARPVGPVGRLVKTIDRHRRVAAGIGVGVLLLVLLVVLWRAEQQKKNTMFEALELWPWVRGFSSPEQEHAFSDRVLRIVRDPTRFELIRATRGTPEAESLFRESLQQYRSEPEAEPATWGEITGFPFTISVPAVAANPEPSSYTVSLTVEGKEAGREPEPQRVRPDPRHRVLLQSPATIELPHPDRPTLIRWRVRASSDRTYRHTGWVIHVPESLRDSVRSASFDCDPLTAVILRARLYVMMGMPKAALETLETPERGAHLLGDAVLVALTLGSGAALPGGAAPRGLPTLVTAAVKSTPFHRALTATRNAATLLRHGDDRARSAFDALWTRIPRDGP